MPKKTNKFDFESEAAKMNCLNQIIGFFRGERNETIGIIAAERILDFFLDTVGEEVYKKAIRDCKKVLKEKCAELEFECETLTLK